MKKWIIFSVVLVTVASLFLLATPGKTKTKSYYSGDALSYNDHVYVATTNTGSLEVFYLDGKILTLVSKIKPYNARFNNYGEFFDAKLASEDGHLYVYAVSNYTLYKYEVLGNTLKEIKTDTNTYWEWYNRVDKFGSNIVTVSAKGVKVFNTDLQIIVAHDFKNQDAPYNVSGNDDFYLNIDEANSKLEIYNLESHSIIKTVPLNFKFDKGNRRAVIDASANIYVVDDYYAKKFDLSGKLLASYKHLDYQGFDIAVSKHTGSVYFSNGVGVVKLDENMKEKDYAWTGNLGGYAGWAMGMKTVYAGGDKVVIFNNSNILILDANLNKVASIAASEQEDNAYPTENLFLKLDKGSAAVNSSLSLSGGGFLSGEELSISFGTQKTLVKADSRGRFTSIITVPDLVKGGHDIRVDGTTSKLHYSISFKVE